MFKAHSLDTLAGGFLRVGAPLSVYFLIIYFDDEEEKERNYC
jgi:hypothetical protein